MRWIWFALLGLARPALADEVPEAMLRAFNQVAREAEAALEQAGAGPAIARYEAGLAGELSGYGRIHLRLGQLHQGAGRMAEAAHHFRECDADERVDALDRELICQAGWRTVTAPLTLEGLPDGARVLVLEPEWFSGPLHSGQRVPLGSVKVVVATPGRPPEEAIIVVEGPRVWSPGAPAVAVEPEAPVAPVDEGVGSWPVWVGAGAGALLVGTGLWLGIDNRDVLADIRDRQTSGRCPDACQGELRSAESTARLADGLWVGGSVVLATSAVLGWFWLGDEP